YDGVYSQVFGVGGETTTVDDATVVTPNVTPVSNDVTATPTTQVTPIIEPTYVEPAPIIIKPMEEFADSGMNNLFPYEPDWSDLNAKTHGNEGLGNGEDPPPPGHDVNMNDGDGASPGNPGAKDGIHKDNANILDEEYGNAKIHGNEGVGNGEDPPPPGHDENMNDGPGTSPGDPGAKHKGEEALKANEDGTGETEADQSKEAPVAPVEAGANKAEAPLPAGNKGLFKQLAAEKGIREIEQKEIKQVFEKVF
ncbi:MAG: hypothetical protein OEL66_07040, partial [Desulfobulbaceae bacterium]|nr:hypothetical protein [Desulfobulbaceae bacterium]